MRTSEFLCVGVLNLQYNIKFKNLLKFNKYTFIFVISLLFKTTWFHIKIPTSFHFLILRPYDTCLIFLFNLLFIFQSHDNLKIFKYRNSLNVL